MRIKLLSLLLKIKTPARMSWALTLSSVQPVLHGSCDAESGGNRILWRRTQENPDRLLPQLSIRICVALPLMGSRNVCSSGQSAIASDCLFTSESLLLTFMTMSSKVACAQHYLATCSQRKISNSKQATRSIKVFPLRILPVISDLSIPTSSR